MYPRERSQVTGEPLSQRAGAQLVRMEHIEQPQLVQAFGPNQLFAPGAHPGHDERLLLERQHLTDGVVAPHRNDAVGLLQEQRRFPHELEHPQPRLRSDALAQPLLHLPRHKRARQEDPVRLRR